MQHKESPHEGVYARPLTTDDRKVVRKLEKEPWNRLRSIREDARWVEQVAQRLSHLPVVANLRCGAWYVPPSLSARSQSQSTYCYFKSTDGHAGQWDFSLKRPNLDVLQLIQDEGGIVVVDSTRRGKSLPDALSKTIPIWCAVMTEAARRRHGGELDKTDIPLVKPGDDPFRECNAGAGTLHTPAHQVPPSEHSQIEERIESWVQKLLASDLPIPRLKRPLVPFFLTRPPNQEGEANLLLSLGGANWESGLHPVVLLGASKRVDLPTPSTDGTFYYTQGSGDDEELWSHGLTPTVFWSTAIFDQLMGAPSPPALSALIAAVVSERPLRDVSSSACCSMTRLAGSSLFCQTGERSGARDGKPADDALLLKAHQLVINLSRHADEATDEGRDPSRRRLLHLPISEGKKGLPALRSALSTALQAVQATLYDCEGQAIRGATILVVDSSLSDSLLSFLVAFLAAFYRPSDAANTSSSATPIPAAGCELAVLCPNVDELARHRAALTKEDVRKRLQWVVRDLPTANPSRAHMVRVNEALLSRPDRARGHLYECSEPM
ncbi:unnamed protein product [Parajaminaea phylloscopi]